MKPEVNITEAPYNADSSGRHDCTEAIVQALDDITNATRLAFRQGMAEVEALPAEGRHYHPGGFENHRDNGAAMVVGLILAEPMGLRDLCRIGHEAIIR